jgi:hypothetical protein
MVSAAQPEWRQIHARLSPMRPQWVIHFIVRRRGPSGRPEGWTNAGRVRYTGGRKIILAMRQIIADLS